MRLPYVLVACLTSSACTAPPDAAPRIQEAYVGQAVEVALSAFGPPDQVKASPGGPQYIWYKTRDTSALVAAPGEASGPPVVLSDTCRLSLVVARGEAGYVVTGFKLAGDARACARFI